ncbi:hypothetical protein GCM10007242_45270 [Pigmentiphaga litoralis]|uniref:hypothetical protein n=1 Tax=Pigmentiphaga litoralis TaxID=516702 RepID=UPI00167C0BE4|nr:hypothetical protein [Pigmentiphaga litoralis]GGX33131.1 hypothetical protein GCM10007242_45270 [Pigmentiphaga litoralis]
MVANDSDALLLDNTDMDLKTVTFTAHVEDVEYLGAVPQDESAVMRVRIRSAAESPDSPWLVSPSFLVSPQAVEALRRALAEYDARTEHAARPRQ